MKKVNKRILTLVATGLISLSVAKAQDTTPAAKQPAKKTTFIMPDGSVLGPGGLDSLNKAWGPGRVAMQHSTDDDEKGIMHIVRITDEMAKLFAAQAAQQQAALKSMIGQQAPDFSLTDLSGKKWTLSELKGKVVVLNFWFTSCPPCIQEMPDLNKLTKAYKADDVVFLALTFNDVKHVERFLSSHEYDYTILTDSHDTDVAYKINSWPTSIVIDKQGKVAFTSNYNPDIYNEIAGVIEKSR